ncbi:MAG: hypothetical protein PHI37_04115 [Candidatus Gracilibacteria bacterium]|nr:hypothetical protein [Candidatus Gracilibacteria bacterium]
MKKIKKLYILFMIGLFIQFSNIANGAIIEKTGIDDVSKTIISYDGLSFGSIYKIGDKNYIEINNKKYGPYEEIETENFFFNKESSDFVFQYGYNQKRYININGSSYGPFDSISDFQFSSKTGKNYRFIYEKNSNTYIVINGKIFGPYTQIDETFFSIDGTNYGFGYKKGEKYYFNINGNEYGESYDWVGNIKISLDGKNFGFVYKKDEKYYFVINKKEYGPYDSYEENNFYFSSNGTKYIMSYKRDGNSGVSTENKDFLGLNNLNTLKTGLDTNGFLFTYIDNNSKSLINVNGNVNGPFESIRDEIISENGKDFGYIYDKQESSKDSEGNETIINTTYVNINGTSYKVDTNVESLNIMYSNENTPFGFKYTILKENGVRENYFNVKGNKYGPFFKINNYSFLNNSWGVSITDKEWGKDYIFLNGKSYGPYDLGTIENIIFSNSNNGYLYNYRENGKRYIVINGKKYGPYDQIDAINFSGDGKGFSYRYELNNAWYIKLNEDDFGPYFRSDYLNYSLDGKTYNYRFEKGGKKYFNFNGKEYGPYDNLIDLVFSLNDSNKFGFIYKNTESYVTINEKTHGPFEDIKGLKVSEDGRGFIFIFKSNGREFINYNGNRYGPCQYIRDYDISSVGVTHAFTCMKKDKWNIIYNELSSEDKKIQKKKSEIQNLIIPVIRGKSKNDLELIYIKIKSLLANTKNKNSNNYILLTAFGEIVYEEISTRTK